MLLAQLALFSITSFFAGARDFLDFRKSTNTLEDVLLDGPSYQETLYVALASDNCLTSLPPCGTSYLLGAGRSL